MKPTASPWLSDPVKETVAIVLPLFLPVAVVFVFQDYFLSQTDVTTFWWILLVLVVDVGHVYSTVFRFYWERDTFRNYQAHLIIIPLVALVVGFLIHYYDSFLFWRLLAYGALYHFIRQQYGFMRLYARKEAQDKWSRLLDSISVYIATLYPVLYWHLHLTDSLSWFVPNDFIALGASSLDTWAWYTYIIILFAYITKETNYSIKSRTINLPKNGIVLGTFLSWYAGIVYFRGDLAFTLMNVVSHGIPYMALIWIYGEKKKSKTFTTGVKGAIAFIGVVILLAYFEETLWDVLVWKDHPEVFPILTLREPLSNPLLLSVLVPLLTLPQITHYVIDGYIWRFSKDQSARIG